MYVDKTLTGLGAVQALSRLNRIHPGKSGTFVLDFVNDAEAIREAFAVYHGKTVAPPSDPNLLFDTRSALDAFGVLDIGEMQAEVMDIFAVTVQRRAIVARQRTCPIGDLLGSDRESQHLEYKSTLRWDINRQDKGGAPEDAAIKTIAGFANSEFGGTPSTIARATSRPSGSEPPAPPPSPSTIPKNKTESSPGGGGRKERPADRSASGSASVLDGARRRAFRRTAVSQRPRMPDAPVARCHTLTRGRIGPPLPAAQTNRPTLRGGSASLARLLPAVRVRG